MISPTSLFDLFGGGAAYRAKNAGNIQNPGQVRQVGGLSIDVSGQSAGIATTSAFEPGPGIKTHKTDLASNLLDPATLGAAVGAQVGYLQTNTSGVDLTREKLEKLQHADPGGPETSPWIASVQDTVTVFQAGAPPETVGGPGFISGDVFGKGEAGETAYRKGSLANQGAAARAESQLAAEYGQDVKVAYDPVGQDYLMLKKGQAGYDSVQSARDAFAGSARDLRQSGEGQVFKDVLSQFADVLGPYGIKV